MPSFAAFVIAAAHHRGAGEAPVNAMIQLQVFLGIQNKCKKRGKLMKRRDRGKLEVSEGQGGETPRPDVHFMNDALKGLLLNAQQRFI